ncbi:MAG: hypothetical protein N2C14_14130, partial [Planctomycetales bacterium]
RVIELKPRWAPAYYNRGVACKESGRFNEALSDLTAAIGYSPQLAQAYECRGEVYVLLREFAKAEADFIMAKKLRPTTSKQFNVSVKSNGEPIVVSPNKESKQKTISPEPNVSNSP